MKKMKLYYPFKKYIFGKVPTAYKTYEDRFSFLDEKLPAVQLVRKQRYKKLGMSAKQDIYINCFRY